MPPLLAPTHPAIRQVLLALVHVTIEPLYRTIAPPVGLFLEDLFHYILYGIYVSKGMAKRWCYRNNSSIFTHTHIHVYIYIY